MPLSPQLQEVAVIRACGVIAALVLSAVAYTDSRGAVQDSVVTDAELETLSSRTIAIGTPDTGRIEQLPLEVYVARVLVGEAEPNEPEATLQALAVAIRTYAVFNAGRHRREGFDLCDSVHCQVPRAANAHARRASLATAGQILTYKGAPAEIFYSASCGGRSEVGSEVWPHATHPYLKSIKDDVHDDDMQWTLELSRVDLQAVLERHGFGGTLKKVEVKSRNKSGRAAVVRLSGMSPDRIAGDQLRAAIGTTRLRSTAFSVDKHDETIRFTGRGYGHGVGMCVIGAGRRARRGESMSAILKTYYPGLEIRRLE